MRCRGACWLLLVPVLAVVALLPGCEGGTVPTGKRRAPTGGDLEASRKELKPKGYGTVSGKVTFEGTPPVRALIAMGSNEGDCHRGATPDEIRDEKWVVSAAGGVKNAVVIIQPPEGFYFHVPDEHRKDLADVKLHQPHCAFQPHVFTVFPVYFDGKVNVATGQKVFITNDAPFSHNYNIMNSAKNVPGGTLPGGKNETVEVLGLEPQSGPIAIKCDIHNWMRTYGFILDHPYVAITGDDGSFTIKNAPLGVEVRVVAWHEGPGFFNGTDEGTPATLADKQTITLPSLKAR
jgi:hypothetical protein